MWNIRGQISELLSEGHVDAPDYPVAFAWEELQHIVERKNRHLASEATILNAAINTGVAAWGKDGGKKANTLFQNIVKRLLGEEPKAPVKQAPPAFPSRSKG